MENIIFHVEKLQKLGLSIYEARAYLALLELGIADAGKIALHAKVPMGRIYGVLSSLEEAYLIQPQETRPRKYTGVVPNVALERLSNNKKEELKQKEAEIDSLVSELVSGLSSVSPGEHGRIFETAAKGEEGLELVRESILGAEKEILVFLACRAESERIKNGMMTERYSQIMDALNKSIEKGVDVKVIFNKEIDGSSLKDLLAVKQQLMHLGDKFNVRLAAIQSTPFNVIDRETVTLRTQNPLNPEELFAVINVRDVELAEEFQEKFFTIWEKAEVIR